MLFPKMAERDIKTNLKTIPEFVIEEKQVQLSWDSAELACCIVGNCFLHYQQFVVNPFFNEFPICKSCSGKVNARILVRKVVEKCERLKVCFIAVCLDINLCPATDARYLGRLPESQIFKQQRIEFSSLKYREKIVTLHQK